MDESISCLRKKVKVKQGDYLPLSSRSHLQNIPTQGRNLTFLQDRNAMFSQEGFSTVIADRGWYLTDFADILVIKKTNETSLVNMNVVPRSTRNTNSGTEN